MPSTAQSFACIQELMHPFALDTSSLCIHPRWHAFEPSLALDQSCAMQDIARIFVHD